MNKKKVTRKQSKKTTRRLKVKGSFIDVINAAVGKGKK